MDSERRAGVTGNVIAWTEFHEGLEEGVREGCYSLSRYGT